MNIRPPLNEAASQSLKDWSAWSQGWSNFFTQLFEAVGWVKGWSFKFILDFGLIAGNTESSGLAASIPGVSLGDSVHVTPYTNTFGIDYKGLVTAAGVVTIYAINYTAAPINPASMQYRVVVIQN